MPSSLSRHLAPVFPLAILDRPEFAIETKDDFRLRWIGRGRADTEFGSLVVEVVETVEEGIKLTWVGEVVLVEKDEVGVLGLQLSLMI